MSEDQKSERYNISSRTGVRVSLGAIAGMVIGFGLFLYTEIQRYHQDANRRFEAISLVLEKKADKAGVDRYTAADAARDISAIEQKDKLQFEAIYRELDHIQLDIRDSKIRKKSPRWGTIQNEVQ